MKVLSTLVVVAVLLCAFTAGNANAAGFMFTNNLTIGARGTDVSALQQFLIDSGFLAIPTPTGYFGSLTRAALGAWQASASIYPSVGFFGPISRGRMNAAVGVDQTPPIIVPPIVSNPIMPSATGLPVRLTIPKLNINAGFQYTGLKSDGTMEIPSNVVDIGWFTGSVPPGEKGVAVITGHVARIQGGVVTKPGVFSNLSELRPGDTLQILNDKGALITFVVRESRNYDPAADATDVFTSKDGGVHLNLITCEGFWEPGKLSFTQRLVVFTDAVIP